MADKKKFENEEPKKGKEISVDELEEVSGGGLRNVQYTKTVDISKDTKDKI